MRWRQAAFATALWACLGLGVLPAAALDASRVILGFGAEYAAPDGSTCTHRGADVAAEVGSEVCALRGGAVRFAGRVPGPHGGTVLAITLDTAEGLVTAMPFERVVVEKGDVVEAGEALGSVAESGDPSSAESHVHVSLRHGDLYVDPAVLFSAAPAPQDPPATDAQPAPTPSSAPPDGRPVRVSEPAMPSSGSATLDGVKSMRGASVPEASLAPATGVVVDVPPAIVTMGEGVSLAPGASGTSAGSARSVSPVSPYSPSRAVDEPAGARLGRIVGEAGLAAVAWLRGADSTSVAAVLVAVVACSGLLSKRAFERRITSNQPVSDRWGTLLQQLRAGDTLRGLTSCSGPLPSQSRSRTAQRR